MLRVPFRDMARCAVVTDSPHALLSRIAALSGVRAVEYKRLKKRPKEAGPEPEPQALLRLELERASQKAAVDAWVSVCGPIPSNLSGAELEMALKNQLRRRFETGRSKQEAPLRFDPALSKAHRRLVHLIAEELRLEHSSFGVEPKRSISVSFGAFSNGEAQEATVEGEENITEKTEGQEGNPEGEKGSVDEEVHEPPVALDEWWRVRCFYDKNRPDFALIHGLNYTPVAANTRAEAHSKGKKGKEVSEAASYEGVEVGEEEDLTRYGSTKKDAVQKDMVSEASVRALLDLGFQVALLTET